MRKIVLTPVGLSFLILLLTSCGKETKNPAGPETSIIHGVVLVSIPGGTFQMGNVENAPEGGSDEKPVHAVTLTKFEMSAYEITNSRYAEFLNTALAAGDIETKNAVVYGKTGAWAGQAYMDAGYEYNPDKNRWIAYNDSLSVFTVASGKENWPVVAVNWHRAKAFALYYGFDLPTEAEWEYACRGGRQYKYGTDNGELSSAKANYNNNVGHPVDVGTYPPNPFGLYEMTGNIWEWCHDWYGGYQSGSVTNPTGAQSGSARVGRGVSFADLAFYCRSAYRGRGVPGYTDSFIGFRVVRRPGGLAY